MANNIRLREAHDPLLSYGTCGTSSHCVPITTLGAENTNNLTRVRRLGPRWQGQLQPNTEMARPGVLLTMPSPSKSLTEPPIQPDEGILRGDAAPSHHASTDFVVTIPPRTGAAAGSPRSSVVNDTASLDTKKRSHLRWDICLALTALTALILLTVIAFHRRAKLTNAGAVAIMNPRSAPASISAVIPPLNIGSVQNRVSAKSETPRDESKPEESAGRRRQPKAGQKARQVQSVASSGQEFVWPKSATDSGRPKAMTDGNANAPVDLANEYLRSEGVPRGCAKAMRLLNTAAAKGNVRARNRLASMYAVGSCVPRDPVRAYRWLGATLDADPSNQWAQQNRDLMLRQMTIEQRSQTQNSE